MTDTPTAEPETLGAYIRAAREGAGYSLKQLGGKIGVSAQAIQQWETDQTTPTPRALHFLSEALPALDPRKMLALAPSGTR